MTLENLWFVIIAVMFTMYFVLEGFDFGVGMLMTLPDKHDQPGSWARSVQRTAGDTDPVLADKRRRLLLNTIGPVWDGNEVWLITGGAAIFAAFGGWYATMFSAFYLPLFLILIGLIVRVVAIEWRGKINDIRWRRWCDVGIGLGSWIPAILWGVAFANVVRGLPIDAEHQYTGGFFNLLNPYALLGGATTLLAFLTHGAVFVALKTAGEMRDDAQKRAGRLAVPTAVVAAAFLLWTQVAYGHAWTWAVVAVAVVAAVGMVVATFARREGWAFFATCVAIVGVAAMLFGALFPDVMPSTTDAAYTLTVANTSSSHYTLVIMTWAAAIMTPVVVAYQAYSYWVFRKRLSVEQIPPSIGLSPQTTNR